MKIQFSLPKNEEFFSDYASLTPTLRKLGYLAQVISALTEFGVLFALIRANLEDLFPAAAGPVGMAGALLGVAFIEVGLRKFAPYSVRAILYRRFSGLHLVISIFVFLVTLGLLGSSGYLSFKGSFDLVEQVAPAPKLATTTHADSTAQARKSEAMDTWRRDSLEVINRFAPQQEALFVKYSTLKEVERQKLRTWEARERMEQAGYLTQKQRIRAKLADLEAEQAEEVSRLEADRGQALSSAQEARKSALAFAVSSWKKEREEVEAGNRQAVTIASDKIARYGGGLAWFTVIALTVFVLAISIEEIHRKGSGVEEVALPNQYYFSETVWAEFWSMVDEKWNYLSRTWIRRQAAKTPPPPEPDSPPVLWEVERPKMNRRSSAQAQLRDNGYSALFDQAFSSNGGELPPEETIGNEGSRVVIQGFQRYREEAFPDPVITQPLVGNPGIPPKACLQCGRTYAPKVAWQKFCSPECKEGFHASRHGGQVFNPGQYHRNNKK